MLGRPSASWIGALLAAATLAAGCGESRVKELCKYLEECGAVNSRDACETTFGVLVLSNACFDAMEEAPCEEHLGPLPDTSYADVCWELCTTTDQYCEGDTVRRCQEGYEFVYDCEDVCKIEFDDAEYTGVCGTLGPLGETSPVAVCWCAE